MRKRKLFLSVTGSARAIDANYVTDDDLKEGLFCLSALDAPDIRKEERCPPDALARLADAVEKALAEGRCVLLLSDEARAERPYNEYRLLNRLLVARGYTPISEDPSDARTPYRQRTVTARLQDQDLEVITGRWGIGSDETRSPESGDSAGETLQ
jgi:hypothetical protein